MLSTTRYRNYTFGKKNCYLRYNVFRIEKSLKSAVSNTPRTGDYFGGAMSEVVVHSKKALSPAWYHTPPPLPEQHFAVTQASE